MNEKLDIKNLSIIELKALAYDELMRLELCQNNLRVLNQEISIRVSESLNRG